MDDDCILKLATVVLAVVTVWYAWETHVMRVTMVRPRISVRFHRAASILCLVVENKGLQAAEKIEIVFDPPVTGSRSPTRFEVGTVGPSQLRIFPFFENYKTPDPIFETQTTTTYSSASGTYKEVSVLGVDAMAGYDAWLLSETNRPPGAPAPSGKMDSRA